MPRDFIIVVAGLAVGIFVGWLILTHMRAQPATYEMLTTIKQVTELHPEFQPHVDEMLADGEITQGEFVDFKNELTHAGRNKLLQDLQK